MPKVAFHVLGLTSSPTDALSSSEDTQYTIGLIKLLITLC